MPQNFGAALLVALLPQLVLVIVGAVCAVLPLLRPRERPGLYRWIACLGLLGAVAACGVDLVAMRNKPTGIGLSAWNGGLSVDHFSIYVTVAACLFGLVTCLLSDTFIARIPRRSGAFFALLLMAVLATSGVASEHEMLTFFVALQLLFVSLAGITALVKTEQGSAGAAWRMAISGAAASAMLLYGLTILYGITGSDDLTTVAAAEHTAAAVAALGTALVIGGLTFFTAMFPFWRWPADAGEHLAAVPAGFVVTMGVSAGATGYLRFAVSGLGTGAHSWRGLTDAVVVIGLLVAAVTALRAARVSTLIAAAASGQAAMLLASLLAFSTGVQGTVAQGTTAFLFALVVFGLSTLAAYGALSLVQNAGLGGRIDDLRGLAHRSPVAAFLISLALATLVGVPPLAGFIARFFILTSLLEAGYGWLTFVGLAGGVLLAIPVLRVIAAMYGEQGEGAPFTLAATPRLGRLMATTCCAAAVMLTVIAEPVLLLARTGAGSIR